MSPCTSNKVGGSGVRSLVARVMARQRDGRVICSLRRLESRWPTSDVAEQKTAAEPITLPGAQRTGRYRAAAANDSLPRYRIMIVQDDFLLRMETAADLRQWGYDVVEAFSEADARRALQADRRLALV